jgi:hypothetical protein
MGKVAGRSTARLSSPNTVTTLIVLAAGAILASGHVVGVYLLVPAVVLALIGGVVSAWMFLSTI